MRKRTFAISHWNIHFFGLLFHITHGHMIDEVAKDNDPADIIWNAFMFAGGTPA